MKKHLILLLSVLFWMGCTKDETTICNQGVIRIVNQSKHPFSIEVDDKVETTAPGAATTYHSLFPGRYKIRYVQSEGFTVSPWVYEAENTDIKACDTIIYVIVPVPNEK